MQISSFKFQIVLLATVVLRGCCGSLCVAQESLESRFEHALAAELETAGSESDCPLPESPRTEPEPDENFTTLVKPEIHLETVEQFGLVKSSVSVNERWLVSEPWCVNCPAAKRAFLSSGGLADHVITIAEAKSRHGKTITRVPAHYDTTSTRDVLQPPTYRLQNIMQTTLDGQSKPTREAILDHLRNGGPHQGKHWQQWHLESWRTPQLYALHDDDHAGVVPTFEESHVVATITHQGIDIPRSPDTLAAALSWHVLQSEDAASEISDLKFETSEATFGALINLQADVPDWALNFGRNILVTQRLDFPDAGITCDWSGQTRCFTITDGRIEVKPGVKLQVRKFRMSKSCTLDAVAFTPDLSEVTFELTGLLDVTVRLE